MSREGAQVAHTGTLPGNQGCWEQESQVKTFSHSLMAKLYYGKVKSYQQLYFLNVGSHSAEQEK